MANENKKNKKERSKRYCWIKAAGAFTFLDWFAMIGGWLVTLLNPGYLPIGMAVTTINFAAQNVTGAVQIWYGCEKSLKALRINWITYVVCNAIEVVLIIYWVLDYAAYCDWGVCGNTFSNEFDGGLVFYYGIAVGVPIKVICDIFVVYNMIKMYEEEEEGEVQVSDEPEVNSFISKNNLTVVILK